VFDPRNIVGCAEDAGMQLVNLIVITSSNGPLDATFDAESMSTFAKQRYQLGVFIFKKIKR
jgi:hypothetical protein